MEFVDPELITLCDLLKDKYMKIQARISRYITVNCFLAAGGACAKEF